MSTTIPPKLNLWYQNQGNFTLDSLIRIVERDLRQKGHPSSREVAITVIALYTVLRSGEDGDPDGLFEILDSNTVSQAYLFFLLPRLSALSNAQMEDFTLGPYTFGSLKPSAIGKLSRQAKSNYFDLYEKDLQGRYALSRTFPKVTLINWRLFLERRQAALTIIPWLSTAFNALVETYFEHLGAMLLESFFRGISEEQLVTFVLSDMYLDEKNLQAILGSDRICIFLYTDGKSENGFVTPTKAGGQSISWPHFHAGIPSAITRLREDFDFTGFQNVEIHRNIQTFARFVCKAKRHRLDDNWDEAMLHFIIALDLLFGEDGKLSESVSERTAAVTHFGLGRTFAEQLKLTKKLYADRSKYVHEGKSPSQDAIDEAEKTCTEVLLCMLRLQKAPERRNSLTLEKWLRNIDLLAATMQAEKIPSEELLIDCGIKVPA